jgi:dTDP-4-dehydrorhamnose 3,5-epimerase
LKLTPTSLPEVKVVEPRVMEDPRGRFFELFRAERFAAAGLADRFVQDNVSTSTRGVLRGLHLQHPFGQAKLICAVRGEIFDVAVDVRVGSPTFGQWVGQYLSAKDERQFYIPAGFAHGFVVTSSEAIVVYKCSEYYHPEAELTIRWNDPAIGIQWPARDPILSAKDDGAPALADIPPGALPRFGS